MTLHKPSLAIWPANVEGAAREVDARYPRSDWTSTYGGHAEVYTHAHGLDERAPNPGKYGVDFLVSSRALGDKIAAYCWANRRRLGIRYVIWWGRIISETGREPGKWLAYFGASSSNPSINHHNHVHTSYYADAGPYEPPTGTSPTAPSSPSGTVPALTGKAFMSDRLDFYAREDQALVPGDNVVWLGPLAADGQHPLSLVSKPTADVDITATVDVRGMDGEPYAGPYALVFRTVAYQKGTPTTTVDDELAVLGSNQARYAGPFTTAPAKGKSNRLRLVLVVPEGVTGLVLHRAAFSGWTA